MPTYDFKCPECDATVETTLASWSDKDTAVVMCMDCNVQMRRQFPFGAAQGIRGDFEPHFDEGLGVNVYSRQERDRILRDRGWIETGDPVGGARNFDAKAPHTAGRLPLERNADYTPRRAPDEDIPIVLERADGSEEAMKLGDLPTLPTPTKADIAKAEKAFKELGEDVASAKRLGIPITLD